MWLGYVTLRVSAYKNQIIILRPDVYGFTLCARALQYQISRYSGTLDPQN